MLTAVSYDVTDNRRRALLAKLLMRYGTRVQKTVFEIYLEEKDLPRLVERIEDIIRPEKDSVRIYRIPPVGIRASIWLGRGVEVKEEGYFLF